MENLKIFSKFPIQNFTIEQVENFLPKSGSLQNPQLYSKYRWRLQHQNKMKKNQEEGI